MTKTDDWGYMVHSLERTVRHFAHAARLEYLRTESLTQPFAFLPELIILPALANISRLQRQQQKFHVQYLGAYCGI